MAKQDIGSLEAAVEIAATEFRRACRAYVAGTEVENGDLWQKLVERSIRAGLSAKEIATIAGCSISTVSRWADGLTVPPVASRHWIRERLVEWFERMEDESAAVSVRGPVPAAAE